MFYGLFLGQIFNSMAILEIKVLWTCMNTIHRYKFQLNKYTSVLCFLSLLTRRAYTMSTLSPKALQIHLEAIFEFWNSRLCRNIRLLLTN